MQIYSELSLKHWSLGSGETKLVAGEEKCSSGQIWYCSGFREVEKLSGETQKCHRVGFHWVCYRGVLKYNLCLLNSSDICHGLFTFARDSNEKQELSVTDYIFVSPDLNQSCKSMMIDEQRHFTPWRKLKTHERFSDHNAIKF